MYFCGRKTCPNSSIISQWAFWYCNNIGVTSPSILLWHCWYTVNETHDDVSLRYQLDINILRLTNQTLMSSWHLRNNGRYPAEKKFPETYTTSVLATIIPRLYCGNWKIKASSDFFSVAATKNMYFFFKTALLYLKVISNIVSESSYRERRTKMSQN